ncbi:MAG: ABC transporter permease, partial [Pirellulales bacterium]|nr:ABC transporter permease [Pirellulales bacterium]
LRGVSGNFFSTLKLGPYKGRVLADQDDDPAMAPVVVLTHRFWTRRLGGDPAIVGQALRINNTLYSIVGVLPASFTGIVPGDATELYVPLEKSPAFFQADSRLRTRAADPTNWWIQLIVRRAAGVQEDELRTALDAAFASSWVIQPTSRETTPRIRLAEASGGLGSIRRQIGDPVGVLLGLVSLVLLVVCANTANLMLARSVSREKEIALRVSLGCDKRRLVRQLFTESLLLASIGGALAIPIAAAIGALMPNLMPAGIGDLALSFELNIRSLAGIAAVTLVAALLFGLYPAWRSSRIDAGPALKEGSGSSGTTSRGRWPPARVLVLAQVSIGLLLVTGA